MVEETSVSSVPSARLAFAQSVTCEELDGTSWATMGRTRQLVTLVVTPGIATEVEMSVPAPVDEALRGATLLTSRKARHWATIWSPDQLTVTLEPVVWNLV